MTNPAYKHLDSKLKIADLSVGAWLGIIGGVLVAVFFAKYLSPFGGMLNLAIGVYVAGIPAAAAYLASVSEFDLARYAKAALAFHRRLGRFQPGPGETAVGYVVFADDGDAHLDTVNPLDLESLWQS